MTLFQEQLMDHYRFPRRRTTLASADFTSSDLNPSCGDRIQFQGNVAVTDAVKDLSFQGEGCILSQATASMLIERFDGKHVQEIQSYSQQDLLEMIGIDLGPNRIKCALLPLFVLQNGVASLQD